MEMTTRQTPRQFHLLIETQNFEGKARVTTTTAGPARLEVPTGIAQLAFTSEAGPQLTDHAEPSAAGFVLEPILSNQQSYLMVRSNGPERLRVNGHLAPRVAILSERDHIQLDEQTGLHVALYHRPRIATPTPDLIGKICPVCLTPFTADPPTVVYHCWNCQCVVHCEGAEKPEDDRLECIKLSPSCPSCNAPVMLTKGYTWKPELNRD